jgi:hypothetical protein
MQFRPLHNRVPVRRVDDDRKAAGDLFGKSSGNRCLPCTPERRHGCACS